MKHICDGENCEALTCDNNKIIVSPGDIISPMPGTYQVSYSWTTIEERLKEEAKQNLSEYSKALADSVLFGSGFLSVEATGQLKHRTLDEIIKLSTSIKELLK